MTRNQKMRAFSEETKDYIVKKKIWKKLKTETEKRLLKSATQKPTTGGSKNQEASAKRQRNVSSFIFQTEPIFHKKSPKNSGLFY